MGLALHLRQELFYTSGMNSTRRSTPPNPNLDLPNRSTDLNKTLGMLGTPHEESIVKDRYGEPERGGVNGSR
jgi:hypothetical protein